GPPWSSFQKKFSPFWSSLFMDIKPEILQLTALRQSRGISLESIAKATKIARYYLRAIEDLDLEKLPPGLYRDTFLRQYAAAIDDDLAEDLHRKLIRAAVAAAEAEAKAIAEASFLRSAKEMMARGATVLFLMGTGSAFGQTPAEAPPAIHQDDPRYH